MRAAEVPDLCPGRYLIILFFIYAASNVCAHFVALLLSVHLCLDLQVESIRLICEVLRGLIPYLSHCSITKVAAGGPRAKGPSPGATSGRDEKGTPGPSKPGAGTGLSPNTDRTTEVQCHQWPS